VRAGSVASPPPTPSPALSATEKTFLESIARELHARFPTRAAAAAAGYFRFTDEDMTGTIAWVNTSNWKSDPHAPDLLWFDVNGRLVGADFSVLQSDSPAAPVLWGISPSRWAKNPLHVHYGVKQSDGGMFYGDYGPVSAAKFGGSLLRPSPTDVVKLGKAQSANQVAFAFSFPAIWDLAIWVVPNPLGAFALDNPNVKPSKSAKSDDNSEP
jgi:hypothetical protein